MRFDTLFEKHQNWLDGTWVIHTALRVWATLTVDPSGDVIPAPIRYRNFLVNSLSDKVKYQSPEQKKKWDKLNWDFYNRIMKRANEYENSFSEENINTIREYLSNISEEASLNQNKIPTDKIATKIKQPYHVNEQRDGLHIAEYMLQLDEVSALSFLENLSIYWAANLPIPEAANSSLEHGRYLYNLAEQME